MKVLTGCSLPRLVFQLSVPEDATDAEIIRQLQFVRDWLELTAQQFAEDVAVPTSDRR